MITTTLANIRAASPCAEGWAKLTKSLGGIRKFGLKTELSVSCVLDSNGINDALWVLARACGEDGRRFCHLFACDVAERSLPIYEKHVPGDNRPRRAIEVKRLWLDSKATDEELYAAWAAAEDAAEDAAWDAAWDAARAAAEDAAWDAAEDAARDAETKWQTVRLCQLLEETK